jgi:transcriptional regulator with XRE-family HTH domain
MLKGETVLGKALRSIRRERGWSLAVTSEATGLSIATLSKVENGKRSLTYDKLSELAASLSVDISRLFSSEDASRPPVNDGGRRSVQKGNDGFVIEAGVYTYTYFAQDLLRKRFSPILMELHAHSLDEFADLLRHSGEEYAYVLEGEVILHTELYAPLRLKQGESIYFDSRMGHAYLNAAKSVARILIIASNAEPGREPDALPVAKQSKSDSSAAGPEMRLPHPAASKAQRRGSSAKPGRAAKSL